MWNEFISKWFQRIIAAHRYFPACSMSPKQFWNHFETLSKLFQNIFTSCVSQLNRRLALEVLWCKTNNIGRRRSTSSFKLLRRQTGPQFENTYFTLFHISKKTWLYTFFEMTYQKVVKIFSKSFCPQSNSHTSLSDHCNSVPRSASVIHSEPLLNIEFERCQILTAVKRNNKH